MAHGDGRRRTLNIGKAFLTTMVAVYCSVPSLLARRIYRITAVKCQSASMYQAAVVRLPCGVAIAGRMSAVTGQVCRKGVLGQKGTHHHAVLAYTTWVHSLLYRTAM